MREKYSVGDTTMDDIIVELKKPNRDPRENLPPPILSKGVLNFSDLKEGMKVTGKVKNVVDFGAFIDIGIKESALIHISELSDQFVRDPMDVMKVGDVREFTIISLDEARHRIGLSLKTREGSARDRPAGEKGAAANAKATPDTQQGQAVRRVVRVAAKPASGSAPAPRPARPSGASSGRPGERENDGMTYNPFADFFKKR